MSVYELGRQCDVIGAALEHGPAVARYLGGPEILPSLMGAGNPAQRIRLLLWRGFPLGGALLAFWRPCPGRRRIQGREPREPIRAGWRDFSLLPLNHATGPGDK
jgi:hypothetical protein